MTTKRFFQGARLPSVIANLVYTDPACPAQRLAHDLAEHTVRALFYRSMRNATAAESCGGSSLEVQDTVSLFYREATILASDLVAATAVDAVLPVLPEELVPTAQPRGPQRLHLTVTGFVVAGTVVFTGTDVNEDVLVETVAVAANGTFLTTAQFRSLSLVTVDGEYTVQVTVPNGRARLVWQDGDLDEVGNHTLVFEILDLTGLRKEAQDPIIIQIQRRRTLPLPVILAVAPDPVAPAGLLTITGTGFLDSTAADIVNQADNSVVPLTGFTVNNEAEVEATVPLATPLGTYWVRVTGPGGSSTLFDGVDVA